MERNKIAVEAIAGTAAGVLTGIAVGIFWFRTLSVGELQLRSESVVRRRGTSPDRPQERSTTKISATSPWLKRSLLTAFAAESVSGLMNIGVAIGIAFFYYLIFGLPVFAVVALIVHFQFPAAIEQDLFNERHFTPYELETFSSFPMSILKTLAFIRGTVAPSTIRKRFGNYDFRAHMSTTFYSLCVTYIILLFIGAVLSLMLAVYGAVITVSNPE